MDDRQLNRAASARHVLPFFVTTLLISTFTISNVTAQVTKSADASVDCSNPKINPGGEEWCDAVKSEKRYEREDKRLNQTYKTFIATLDEHERASWTDAQRKWLTYMKAHCAVLAAKGSPAASIRQWNYMECQAEQTSQRTKILLENCESAQCK